MAFARTCDVCHLAKQRLDKETMQPVNDVFRYGLSRQFYESIGGVERRYRMSSYGGIDLCGECWDTIAKPKTKPHTRGKTGPKPKAA